MKKLLSIATVALMMAGSTAFAGGCGGCSGDKDKDKDKNKSASQELACGGQKEKKDKTACGEVKKDEKAQTYLACHHNKDKDKKETTA